MLIGGMCGGGQMDLGYRTYGLDCFYEVMHSWAMQEYFKKCGINIHIVEDDRGKGDRNKALLKLYKQIITKIDKNVILKEKYESFIKEYITLDDGLAGRYVEKYSYTFGKLLVPKKYENGVPEDADLANFVPVMLLLNQRDYLRFISPVDCDKPYVATVIENEELYKTDYINRFMEKYDMRQVIVNEDATNYKNATAYKDAGPKELISLVFHSDGVITDSFAVLELALVFRKRFLYMNGGRGEGKAALLLEQMRMFHHFITDPTKNIVPLSFKTVTPRVMWNQMIRIRKNVKKRLDAWFANLDVEGIDTEALDGVECPTGVPRIKCYGCLACKEVCPANAIIMANDKEEFLYPITDYAKCTQCGLCAKVCIRNAPPIVKHEEDYPKAIYARHKVREVQLKSTSGAIFPELARYAIEEKKGVVVGVRYGEDVIDVRSDIAETMEEVEAFYGSKYVKSKFDGIFPRVKAYLDEGRYVLYSGLPCECAGLRNYLMKEYDNLLVCELLCHSVPSPKIYRKYIKYLQGKRKSKILELVFRQKTEAYAKLKIYYRKGLTIYANYAKNNYYRAFYNNYICRPSCSKCAFVNRNRVADITIGDFLGVVKVFPDFPDKRGISCVLLNNKKGFDAYERIADNYEMGYITVRQAFSKNYRRALPLPPEREELFKLLNEDMQIDQLLARYNDLLEIPKVREEPPEAARVYVVRDTSRGMADSMLKESDISEVDEDKKEEEDSYSDGA